MDVSVTHFGAGGATPDSGARRVGLNDTFAPTPPSRATKVARLSAGVVPGTVSFDPPAGSKPAPSMSLHAAPADRNTAATGVALGRVIDVTA